MCFYYSISKKNTDTLIENWKIRKKELSKLKDKPVANGFQHPIMPVITNEAPHEISLQQWGLIPNSIVDEDDAVAFRKSYNTLNAKSESLFASKIYSYPAKNKRCLVLASGFMEWQHANGKKTPYYISLKDEPIFAFAGIWDSWSDEKGNKFETYSIITTHANELMSQIHNTKMRMPVILESGSASKWLASTITEDDIKEISRPYDDKKMKAYTIKNFLTSNYENKSFEDIFKPLDYYEMLKGNGNTQLTIDF